MATQKADAAAVQRGLDLIETGRSVVEAAREAGISKTRLYEELKKKGKTLKKCAPPAAITGTPALDEAIASGDDAAILEGLITETHRRLQAADEVRYGPLAERLAQLVTLRAKARAAPSTEAEVQRRLGDLAKEVVARIEGRLERR